MNRTFLQYWPLALCLVSGLMLFAVSGNTHMPDRYGPSILSWLIGQWRDPGLHTAYGWLIFPISFVLVWRQRDAIRQCAGQGDNRALLWIVACLFLYWAGYRAQQPRLGVVALAGLLWSGPFYLWGKTLARQIAFPCAYTLFALPLEGLAAFSFPLRAIATTAAVFLLNGLGIETLQDGTVLRNPGLSGFALDVDDPCSGLQSLIAMSALTAVFAYLTLKTTWLRWFLFLAAIPFAMAGNVVRILTIAIVAKAAGQEIAMSLAHYASGLLVFIAATLLMLQTGAWLATKEKQS